MHLYLYLYMTIPFNIFDLIWFIYLTYKDNYLIYDDGKLSGEIKYSTIHKKKNPLEIQPIINSYIYIYIYAYIVLTCHFFIEILCLLHFFIA